jgi:hypothetical protein
LIPEEIWTGITTLPDDVAIRTSDHNGKALGDVYWLWGKWIEATGETVDVRMFDPMLDAFDDLQSSIFSALHGYYRAAFSALRKRDAVLPGGLARRASLSGPSLPGLVSRLPASDFLSVVSILLVEGGSDRELVAELFIDDPNVLAPELLKAFQLAMQA